jgi:protein O-mannosyl-transferase
MPTRIDRPAASPRATIWLAALLALAVIAVYGQTAGFGFVDFDDYQYVAANPNVSAGITRRGLAWAFTAISPSYWHPLTFLSHMLDASLFGLNPGGHHLTSVALHVANTLLLLHLLDRTTRRYWSSLFVAALFALHPLRVESVAWIAERKDVLSTFFLLLTLTLYSLDRERRRPAPYWAAVATYAAGLMAKPMLVTLPVLLLLWDVWPLKRVELDASAGKGRVSPPPFGLVLEKAPFFALSLLSCAVTAFSGHEAGAVATLDSLPLSFRLINALHSYVRYLGDLVWPTNLAIIYPIPKTLSVATGILAGAALLAVSSLVWRLRRELPSLLVGWCWYLVTLLPAIGLVQVGQQARADRFTYVPLIGIFIMIAWGLPALWLRLGLRRELLAGAAVVSLAACTALTWVQLGHWRSSTTVFNHAIEVVPDNFIAYRLLGNALVLQGDFPAAEHAFQASARISPDEDLTHAWWGAALLKQGKVAEAIEQYSAALSSNPDAENQAGLGRALAAAGRIGEAIEHYRQALLIEPSNADLDYLLGAALGRNGDIPAAIEYLGAAVARRPDFAEAHYDLGIALIRSGNTAGAIEHFSAALQVNPDFAEARRSLAAARSLRQE